MSALAEISELYPARAEKHLTRPSLSPKFTFKYSASNLCGHEEAGMWERLASPAVGRKWDRVQTKCYVTRTRRKPGFHSLQPE
jgi:hypothetical protein